MFLKPTFTKSCSKFWIIILQITFLFLTNIKCTGGGFGDIIRGAAWPGDCAFFDEIYDPKKIILGYGEEDAPFHICHPEQLAMIGARILPEHTFDKIYGTYNYKGLRIPDNQTPTTIGGPCGSENTFKGIGRYDGKGRSISNIGFTSADKKIFVKNLFGCQAKVKDVKYSHALTDAQVCSQIDQNRLITREDNATGPFIVCSQAHLNAIDDSSANLQAHYAMYQNINLNNQIFNSIGGTFTGTFDGRGYKIHNFRIQSGSQPRLFSNIDSSKRVKNLDFQSFENIKYTYTCTNGTVSAGTTFNSQAREKCTACNTGYRLKNGQCGLIKQQKILASDKAEEDWFGVSVSLSGDYAIVGALNEDAGISNISNAGAAYIFKRDSSTNTWSQQVKILANDKQANDFFGSSVALSGDYAIVGAYYEDEGGNNAGAAYIFKRSGATWSQQVKIQANDKQASDNFGVRVALSGDYAIVGAYFEDQGGADAGAAYIFKRDTGAETWSQQAKIQASDKEAGDNFGISVSIAGDYAIVGAHQEDTGGVVDAGAAYIFKRSGITWSQQAKIQASDKQAGDHFGYSVSIAGDYAIVGAHQEDEGGADAGAAYIFKRSGITWSQQVKILASDKQIGDDFGYPVSLSGDYAIVGAHRQDEGGANAGAAYIFKRDPNTDRWSQQAKILATDKQAGGWFGQSVSIAGGYAIVGSNGKDENGKSNVGAAYIFRGIE